MKRAIQARLDDKSEKALKKLRRHLGWNDSKIIRQSLRKFAETFIIGEAHGIIGVGKFESGIADLATHKRHLRDFGR